MMAIKQLVAVVVLASLLTLTNVDAKTECGMDIHTKLAKLEEKVSKMEIADKLSKMELENKVQQANVENRMSITEIEKRLNKLEEGICTSQVPQSSGGSSNVTQNSYLSDQVERLAGIAEALQNLDRSCNAANSVVTESPKGSTDALVTETIDTTVSPQPNGCDGNFVHGNTPYVIMTHKDIGKQIRCDVSTDGGRWIVIQRRISGAENFNRNWADYREGFGNLTDEFWLGNEAVYRLTDWASHEYELRIDFRDEEGKEWFATFKSFKLSYEQFKYRLRIGAYTGPLGSAYRDSLVYEGNAAFTTYDQDNDDWGQGNCAVQRYGGWWFSNGMYCGRSHLNGRWGHNGGGGIHWVGERGNAFPRFTEMKIRPIN